MSYHIDVTARIRMLRQNDFEGLKEILLEIISETDEKLQKIIDKIDTLEMKSN